MTFYIAEDYIRDDILNRTLIPNGFKWDLSIDNIVYHSNTSKIAFILAIDSSGHRTREMNNTESVDSAASESDVTIGNSGRFSWVNWVNGRYINRTLSRNTDLIASILFADTSNYTVTNQDDDIDGAESRDLIALSPVANDQPTTIDWDPTILVDDQSLDSSSAYFIGSNFVLLFVLLSFLGNFF